MNLVKSKDRSVSWMRMGMARCKSLLEAEGDSPAKLSDLRFELNSFETAP